MVITKKCKYLSDAWTLLIDEGSWKVLNEVDYFYPMYSLGLDTFCFCWLLFLDKINSLSPTGSNYQSVTTRRFSLHFPGSIQSTPRSLARQQSDKISFSLFSSSLSLSLFLCTLSANSGANKVTNWSKQIAMMQLLRARAISKSDTELYFDLLERQNGS